jgi:hypothetical protein
MSKMVPNIPCDEGRELGRLLAGFCDKSEPINVERCASCVFRKGTFANGCLSTVANAMKCTLEADPFYCAHEREGEICAGYMRLRAASPEKTKAFWDFVDGETPVVVGSE